MDKPMTYEEWKGEKAPSMSDEMTKSMNRLHKVDVKKEFEEMLKLEYQNYLDDFNGNWLLK